jgi:hypothetical protein
MVISIIGILVVFLFCIALREIKNSIKTEIKERLESMEKIDDYLNNIIEKNYKNKNKNTRQKNCPISENIINIEKEINKH